MNFISSLNANLYQSVTLDKGDVLFHEGERCQTVGIVTCGEIVIASTTLSGNEILLKKVEAGDLFGHNLVYSEQPEYRGNVQCTSPRATILMFTKENLEIALSTSPDFLRWYLKKNADEGNQLHKMVKVLSFDNAEERLFYFLKVNHGHYQAKSISDLARTLNLRRETLSRLLSKLEKENKIKRNGNQILSTVMTH